MSGSTKAQRCSAKARALDMGSACVVVAAAVSIGGSQYAIGPNGSVRTVPEPCSSAAGMLHIRARMSHTSPYVKPSAAGQGFRYSGGPVAETRTKPHENRCGL